MKLLLKKDVKIEELEEKIHNLQATMKDISNNHGDDSNYTLITWNNALRTNLKQKEKEIAMLLEENKEMKKVIIYKILSNFHQIFSQLYINIFFMNHSLNFKYIQISKADPILASYLLNFI